MYYAFFKQKLTSEMSCHDKNTVLDNLLLAQFLRSFFFSNEHQCCAVMNVYDTSMVKKKKKK